MVVVVGGRVVVVGGGGGVVVVVGEGRGISGREITGSDRERGRETGASLILLFRSSSDRAAD